MSNLLFNIRFGTRHFQIHKNSPFISWTYNAAHKGNPTNKRFAVYTWFGKYPLQKENK